MLVSRHPLATTILVAATAIVAGVFVFARPQYHPAVTVKNYDMATRPHFTVGQVRSAFAAHGIDLRYQGLMPGQHGSWMRSLTAVPPTRADTTHLSVSVFGPRAKVGWGVTRQRLDTVQANIAVTYDGTNDDVVRRAKAALSDLR